METNPYLDRVRQELLKYGPVPDAEWQEINRVPFELIRFNKGQHFVKIGDIPDKMGFIWSGLFRVFYLTEQGDERILVFRAENRFLAAFSAFLESIPSWYGIQALEPSLLLCMHLDDYKRAVADHPWLSLISRKYVEAIFLEKEKREREFLSENAETRYLTFRQNYPDIESRVPQHQVASYLGITPVALSRTRKALRKKSLIP